LTLMRDGFVAKFCQRLGQLRHTNAGIDQHFAVGTGEEAMFPPLFRSL